MLITNIFNSMHIYTGWGFNVLVFSLGWMNFMHFWIMSKSNVLSLFNAVPTQSTELSLMFGFGFACSTNQCTPLIWSIKGYKWVTYSLCFQTMSWLLQLSVLISNLNEPKVGVVWASSHCPNIIFDTIIIRNLTFHHVFLWEYKRWESKHWTAKYIDGPYLASW